DTNNGRRYEDYIGRPESHWEDVQTANQAAARAPRGARARVRAETLVHLQAAGEWGWDMSTGRQAAGGDLSHTNTTNIVPLELQCMLADAAELLAYSYSVQRRYAESQGNMVEATRCYEKELHYSEQREGHLAFIRTHMRDPKTGLYHDVELLGASASYDRHRTYAGAARTRVVTAAMLHTLYSGVTDGADSLAVIHAVDKELLGPGGIAVTNIETGEQWDSPNDWAAPTRVGVCGPVHAAARVAPEDPGIARELLDFSKQVKTNALHGANCGYVATGTMVETIHAFAPTSKPVRGEYPKDAKDPGSPRNFSMRAEEVVEMSHLDVDEKAERLAPSMGRFVVARG
ncbi:MAG TPA: trehalase family glycosidase, partial [Candidatus Saccharimonadales bacterium]